MLGNGMKSSGTGRKGVVELREAQPGKSAKHRTSIFQVAKAKGFAKQAAKTLTHIQKSGADGLQKGIQNAKTMISKQETDKHQLLLSPLISMKYQLNLFFGYKPLHIVSADKVKLKVKRMLLDAETDADAASLLVPVAVTDDTEKVMNKNWFSCCGMCNPVFNPGIDFLFNRQQFYFVLIVAYMLIFMSLIMLNYEAYGFPPPTCRSLTLDQYVKGRVGWFSKDRMVHNEWSSTTRNLSTSEFSIIPMYENICASEPFWKGMDAIGICQFFSIVRVDNGSGYLTASLMAAIYSK